MNIAWAVALTIAAAPPAGGAVTPSDPGTPQPAAPTDGAPTDGAPSGDDAEAPATVAADAAPEEAASSGVAAGEATTANPTQPSPGPEADPPKPQFGTGEDSQTPTPPTDAPDFVSAPGGYWGPTDTKDLPPSDGRRKILVGSILAPLGLFATASGAVFSYLFVPEHCVERTAAAGLSTPRDRCGGLFTLNVIRASYGGLMLATGTVFFVMGLRERAKRREWDTHHTADRGSRRRIAITPTPGGLSLRF